MITGDIITFACQGNGQTVAVCRRATSVDSNKYPTNFGLVRSMQAGMDATCDQIQVGGQPTDNAACCTSDFGMQWDAPASYFYSISPSDFANQCSVIAT